MMVGRRAANYLAKKDINRYRDIIETEFKKITDEFLPYLLVAYNILG